MTETEFITDEMIADFLTEYMQSGDTTKANRLVEKNHGKRIANRTVPIMIRDFNERPFEVVRHRVIDGVSLCFRAIPCDVYAWEQELHPRVWAYVSKHRWKLWSIEVLAGNSWYSFDYDSCLCEHTDLDSMISKLKLIDFFNELSININHLPKSWVALVRPILKREYQELDENRRYGLRNFDEENKMLDCIP
jgi:hypothetical protein